MAIKQVITRSIVGIESFIDLIGKATAWVALLMISLVAINVLLRYTLSMGSVWAQELEWHLLAGLILLGMSHALQRGDNVRVDLFYARYTSRTQFVVDGVSVLLIITVAMLFVYLSLNYVAQSYAINEMSPDPGGIPHRWLVKSLIPIGYTLLALQSVGQFMRLVLTYFYPKEMAHV